MCAMIRMVWEDDCSWNEVATSETTNNASGMRFRPEIYRPPDSAVLVIREGYVRLDGWCSRAHVSSRMVSRASELVNLLLIQ